MGVLGTRVPVRSLFENLEDGATIDPFLAWFPGVSRTQAAAALQHAAVSFSYRLGHESGHVAPRF